jgi:hypothetical protein
MATVTLTVQDSTRAGATLTYTSNGASPALNTSDTFTFVNTGREAIVFQKTGANPCTVTIDTPGTVDGLAVGQRTATVAAGTGDAIATTTVVMVGPFPPSTYNTPGTPNLSGFTVSEATGLNCRIVRLP